MAEKTGISWTDHTFNPWWGCTKVSPGCDNCYAESDAHRYGFNIWGQGTERRFFGEKHWNEPRKWNKKAEVEGVRRKVFCASMADIAERNPKLDGERLKLWQLVYDTPWLDWLMLTKRPQELPRILPADWGQGWDNVWLGTTVESQEYEWRIKAVQNIPAIIHFLSIEPQIGLVTLRRYLARKSKVKNRHRIDWAIIGGESGSGAREFRLEWARAIIDECREYDVAVFNKQLGTVAAKELHLIQRKGADPNEWPEDIRVQEFPLTAVA